jgi:hypothetical protein
VVRQKVVAIEVKSSRRYRGEFKAGIRALESGFGGRVRSFIVYRSNKEQEWRVRKAHTRASFSHAGQGGVGVSDYHKRCSVAGRCSDDTREQFHAIPAYSICTG